VVKKSITPQHQAVFATSPLSSDQTIFHYGAPLETIPTKYTLQLNEKYHIDSRPEHEWRYLNHSCEPNTTIANIKVEQSEGGEHPEGSFEVKTLKDVEQGEELTFNYLATEYDMATPFKCICNAPTCVGDVKGYKYLSEEQKERLEQYGVMPYVKRKDRQAEEEI